MKIIPLTEDKTEH